MLQALLSHVLTALRVQFAVPLPAASAPAHIVAIPPAAPPIAVAQAPPAVPPALALPQIQFAAPQAAPAAAVAAAGLAGVRDGVSPGTAVGHAALVHILILRTAFDLQLATSVATEFALENADAMRTRQLQYGFECMR